MDSEAQIAAKSELCGKPFVSIKIDGSAWNTAQERNEYLTSKLADSPELQSAFLNPKGFFFRGFRRSLKTQETNGPFQITYQDTLKIIDEYGIDKTTDVPNPRKPIWVAEDYPSMAVDHAMITKPDEVGFVLIYKGSDSITQDPYSYKDFGIFFDSKKIGDDESLKTYKGRLVGVIEMRLV